MIDSLGSKIQIHRIGPLKIGKIDFSRKPLEQEPCGKDINVLDKIRDEIERKAHSGQWSDATMYGMLKAVAIIDKYKAESEDKEC